MTLTVLVVDDSKTMRGVHRTSLTEVYPDIKILEAANGLEALDKVKEFENSINLVLLDWNMPEMDGLEFLSEFRKSDKKTPVMMVTTEAEKIRIVTAIKAGASSYIIKPFTKENLQSKVNEVLSAVAARKECKFQSECSFYQKNLDVKSTQVNELRDKFCHAKNEECALYKVIDRIGVSSLAPNKCPLDIDWADGLLVCMGNWGK